MWQKGTVLIHGGVCRLAGLRSRLIAGQISTGNTSFRGEPSCSGKGLRIAGIRFPEFLVWTCPGTCDSVDPNGYGRLATTPREGPMYWPAGYPDEVLTGPSEGDVSCSTAR